MAKIDSSETLTVDPVAGGDFSELFPAMIRIVSDRSSPPKLKMSGMLSPYNHDAGKLAPDTGENSVHFREDLDALVLAFDRVSALKDEMTAVIDLVLKMRRLESEIAAAEEKDQPALQVKLDAITAQLV